MRGSRVSGVLVAAAVLAACGGGGGGAQGPTTTVMVFLAADNDLEQFALDNLNAMEAVGSSAAVNIVVEIDTNRLPVAGSTTTKRLRIVRDANPAAVTSPVLQNLGETNTATGAAITAFVSWAIANFPADRYVLILWDHGGGWLGYATDETSGEHLVSLADLRKSLEDIRSRTGVQRLDMLGFDACSMATLEVAQPLFDENLYLQANPDVEKTWFATFVGGNKLGFGTPWEHYVRFGQYEGRKASADFDEGMYLRENGDVAGAIRSVLAQTYSRWQLVVVDDHDALLDLPQSFLARFHDDAPAPPGSAACPPRSDRRS